MGFLEKLASLLGGGEGEGDVHYEYVRCSRCGEAMRVRVDLRNELTRRYGSSEGAYYVRKGVLGSGENRCFQTIEVELTFDANRQLVSRHIAGGEFISQEAFRRQEGDQE